jgi:hypothetical protein
VVGVDGRPPVRKPTGRVLRIEDNGRLTATAKGGSPGRRADRAAPGADLLPAPGAALPPDGSSHNPRAPEVEVEVLPGCGLVDGRIVDEDVDPPEFIRDPWAHSVDRGRVADVEPRSNCPAAGAGDERCRLAQVVDVARGRRLLRPSDLVLPASGGKDAWSSDDWATSRKRGWRPAAKDAGLCEDTRPRDLRGSFASLLIWQGRTPSKSQSR